MVPMQVTTAFLTALFDILTAGPDVLSLWKIGLFTGNPVLSAQTLLADLTEPTYPTYGQFAATPPVVEANANGDLLCTWPTALFQPTAIVAPPQIVTGVFIQATLSATATLLAAGLLATPKTFAKPTDALSLILQTVLPNQLVYGGIAAQV